MMYSGAITEYFSQLHCGDDLTNAFPTISSHILLIAKISLAFNLK